MGGKARYESDVFIVGDDKLLTLLLLLVVELLLLVLSRRQAKLGEMDGNSIFFCGAL